MKTFARAEGRVRQARARRRRASSLASSSRCWRRARASSRSPARSSAEHLDGAAQLGLPVVALERARDLLSARRARLLVCVGYRRVNRAREELTGRFSAAVTGSRRSRHPAAWVSLRRRARRRLRSSSRAPSSSPTHRSRPADPLERQPRRARLPHRRPSLPRARTRPSPATSPSATGASSARTRPSATASRSAPDCVVGAGALVEAGLAAPGTVLPRGRRRRPSAAPQLRLREPLTEALPRLRRASSSRPVAVPGLRCRAAARRRCARLRGGAGFRGRGVRPAPRSSCWPSSSRVASGSARATG